MCNKKRKKEKEKKLKDLTFSTFIGSFLSNILAVKGLISLSGNEGVNKPKSGFQRIVV